MMLRCWLTALLCALVLTAGMWGMLHVYHENSISGFSGDEILFGVRTTENEVHAVEITLLGESLLLNINRAADYMHTIWLVLSPGIRAAYTLCLSLIAVAAQ